MAEPAIRVENLSKRYKIGAQPRQDTLRDAFTEGLKSLARRKSGEREDTTLWALREVSFEIQRGEAVGIIGRNGAGKSTLLKILSQITEPSSGRAVINGRVGSLLEVGTGFHPELTGRENIYLYGAILGMRREEILGKFDEIVAFAEIERFLDTPVKRYSSGMYVRLAFAVAAHLEPEILLVDEVLAVGDAVFQKKCLGKMNDVSKEGRTVLFVSHQMNAIRELCSASIWLDKGKVIQKGETKQIVSNYLGYHLQVNEWSKESEKDLRQNPFFNPSKFYLVDDKLNKITGEITADTRFGVMIEGDTKEKNPALSVGFGLFSSNGDLLFWALHTDVEEGKWPTVNIGQNKLVAWIPPHFLNEGDYRIELHISLHYREWFFKPGYNSPSIGFSIRGKLSDSPHWINARPGLLAPVINFEKIEIS